MSLLDSTPEDQARMRNYNTLHPSAGHQVTNCEHRQDPRRAMNPNTYRTSRRGHPYYPTEPQSYGMIPTGNGQVAGGAYPPPINEQQAQMQSFLQELDSRDEQQRSLLARFMEQSLGHLSRAAFTIKNGVSHLLGSQQDRIQIAELQKKLKAITQDKTNLEAQAQHLSSKNDSLQKQLQQAQDKLAKALEERDDQRRITDGATLADSAKVTDDAVCGKWKQIDYNIQRLAKALAKVPTRRSTDETARRRFLTLTPKWRILIAEEDFREFLIYAYLWMVTTEQAFDGKSGVWAGDTGATFKSIRDQIIACLPAKSDPTQYAIPSLQQGARWVAQGSTILEHIWGRSNKAFEQVVASETQRLGSFCDLAKSNTGTTASSVAEDMAVIIRGAIDLDWMFMCSKAIFFIRWPDEREDNDEPLAFDRNLMEAIGWKKDLSPKSLVQLVISPNLHKMGNADGQNYDQKMVLTKATVVCD
ncbi:hypothetical protein Neosp_006661 [[Neocosmospora] mangrovei]